MVLLMVLLCSLMFSIDAPISFVYSGSTRYPMDAAIGPIGSQAAHGPVDAWSALSGGAWQRFFAVDPWGPLSATLRAFENWSVRFRL